MIHRRRRGFGCCAIVAVLGALPAAASAQAASAEEASEDRDEVSEDRDEEGRALFTAAVTAYQAGRYEDALGHFRAAYEASRRPELLYNVGQAADRARRDREAIEAFEEYLRLVPDSDRRAQVEERLSVLRRTEDGSDDEEHPTSTGASALDAGPFVLGGLGLAVAGAGLAMVLVASGDASAIASAPDASRWADYSAAYDRVEPLSLSGQALVIAGAAAVSGAVIWLIVQLSSGGGERAILQPGPGGLAWGGSW